jgi:AcrR family transcriptional regulator
MPPPSEPAQPTKAISEQPPAPSGTKLQIIEAALQTLKQQGFAGASARAIAREGSFNQALIFYHFASVRNLLLAVLDLISERRMHEYGVPFERASKPTELAALARTIYEDDLERGYITVLGEMVSAGIGDRDLAADVAARIEPWIEMVERKLEQMTPAPLRALASPRDLAFGLVALYFGVDMLSHLQGEEKRARSLLDLATRLSALAETFMPNEQEEAP